MAVTKTINGSTSSSNWTFRIIVEETSTSIANNTSDVRVRGYLGRPSGNGGYGYSGNYNWQVKIDNNSSYTRSGSNYQSEGAISGGGWSSQALFDTTITIPHNADGTKTINVVGSMSTGDFSPSNASASGSVTLTALHTPPLLTLSSVAENSSKLSGVDGTTFVNNISEKIFTLSYTMYDNATASSLKIYDKNDNELTATTSLSTSSGTITVDFKNAPISSNAIVNNKTTFKIKLIDNLNGITTITTPEYTVISYFAPNLITTASNVKRNGQTTGKAVLNLTGQFYNETIGNTTNAITLSFKYWTGSTEPSTYYDIPSAVNTGSGNNISISNWEFKKNNTTVTDLDKSDTYKFKIKAVDCFGSEYQSIIELTLAKGEWLMAKFKNRVDFLAATIGGNPIIDSGSNNNGNYIKYYDGTMMCYKTVTSSVAMTTQWGNLYEGSIVLGDWPVEFTDVPNVQVTNNSGAGAMIESFTPKPTKTSAGTLYLARAGSHTANVTIAVFAIGRWK